MLMKNRLKKGFERNSEFATQKDSSYAFKMKKKTMHCILGSASQPL